MCLRSWLWVYQVTFHNKIKKAWKSNLHNLPLTRYLTSIHRILKIWKPEKSFDSSELLNSILPTLQTQLILSIKTLQISSIPKPLIKPLTKKKNISCQKYQKSMKNFKKLKFRVFGLLWTLVLKNGTDSSLLMTSSYYWAYYSTPWACDSSYFSSTISQKLLSFRFYRALCLEIWFLCDSEWKLGLPEAYVL